MAASASLTWMSMVQIPIGLEAAHNGSIDLISRRAYTFTGDNGAPRPPIASHR
jgi:hypothetical protein